MENTLVKNGLIVWWRQLINILYNEIINKNRVSWLLRSYSNLSDEKNMVIISFKQ